MTKSGSDGMITSGTTGDHPSTDSLPRDGPGIRDSGITTDGSSNMRNTCGSDSKDTNGSNMLKPLKSTQLHQEAQRFADHSTCLRNGDSQPPSELRLFQDAKSELENLLSGICGKTELTADSSVVNLFTKESRSVRLEDLISSLKSLDASKVQSSPRRD